MVDYIDCGDCLELMKEMEDHSVDYVFTSPPYNDAGNDKDSVWHNKHQKYSSPEKYDDYFEWLCERIDEMIRVTRKCVMVNIQGLTTNRKCLYRIIGRYADRIHDIIIWNKTNPCPTSTPHKISNAYEMVLLIKPDGVKGVDVNTKSYYTNVITLPVNSNNKYSNIHRAVMSTDFCMEIIREFTDSDSVVLDPFMGLGTTAICCKKLGRHYIGFEISKDYVEVSLERIKEECAKEMLWN